MTTQPETREPDAHVHAFEPSPLHGGFVCGCGEFRESRSVQRRLAVQRDETPPRASGNFRRQG